MPTVYVTQEAELNFTPALSFGEIQFLTRDDLSSIKHSLKNEALVDQIRHKLMKFDAGEDYIVSAGSPYVAALVFYLLGRYRKVRYVRMLRWSNREQSYSPLIIDIGE